MSTSALASDWRNLPPITAIFWSFSCKVSFSSASWYSCDSIVDVWCLIVCSLFRISLEYCSTASWVDWYVCQWETGIDCEWRVSTNLSSISRKIFWKRSRRSFGSIRITFNFVQANLKRRSLLISRWWIETAEITRSWIWEFAVSSPVRERSLRSC